MGGMIWVVVRLVREGRQIYLEEEHGLGCRKRLLRVDESCKCLGRTEKDTPLAAHEDRIESNITARFSY